MQNRYLFDLIAALVYDYRNKAIQAVNCGNGKLYVPGYLRNNEIVELLQGECVLTQSGGNPKEPAYLSLEEALRGRNADGSLHNGFIVMDVIDHEITAVIDGDLSHVFYPTSGLTTTLLTT